jgi:hypothetical protein
MTAVAPGKSIRMTTHVDAIDQARATAATSDWTERAGRLGLVARGVVYVLLGIIAFRIATGGAAASGETADKGGALQLLAEQPLGGLLLALLALGLASYAAWRLVEAFVYRSAKEHKEWAKRAGYLGRAIAYGGAAFAAVSVLRHRSGGGAGAASEHTWTSVILGWGTIGQLMIGAVGLGFLAAGAWNAYRAVTRKFEEKLVEREMSHREEQAVVVIGTAGLLGRAVAFAAIGWFVAKAAVEADPNKPLGLDESLRQLAQGSFGPLVLGLVALGLFLFGLYSMAEARWRDVTP